jgi:hypothetical protein
MESLKDTLKTGRVRVKCPPQNGSGNCQEMIQGIMPNSAKVLCYWTFGQSKNHPPTKFILSIDGY